MMKVAVNVPITFTQCISLIHHHAHINHSHFRGIHSHWIYWWQTYAWTVNCMALFMQSMIVTSNWHLGSLPSSSKIPVSHMHCGTHQATILQFQSCKVPIHNLLSAIACQSCLPSLNQSTNCQHYGATEPTTTARPPTEGYTTNSAITWKQLGHSQKQWGPNTCTIPSKIRNLPIMPSWGTVPLVS